jgi:ATP-dependent Clp protease ATP-binding subunit ClpC
MYAQFTDRARKAMQLTDEEARRLNHEYIGTEHVLLGLLAEGTGVGAHVLKSLGIDHRKAQEEIEKIVQGGPDPVPEAQLPMTPRAKKVLEYAVEEARTLSHNYVGTEHLLLGLMRESEGVAAQVLMNLGLNLKGARQEVLSILGRFPDLEDEGSALDLAEPPEVSNAEIQHLPDPARDIVEEFECQIDVIQGEKEKAVAAQEFEKAANLRDLADKLRKLKDEFIRQWPRKS